MTLIDDFVTDCQLRGIRYPKTAVYYIRDFATTREDLQNANMADLKRYLAWLRGDAPRGAMGPYTSDRRTWRRETAPILNQQVEVCMRCGFIYGEATELQKKLWGVQEETR